MQLVQHFKDLTLHPKNAKELKGLILQLAIQGNLTANWRNENPDVESASELLKKIEKEKAILIKEKKIKKEKPLSSISNDEMIRNLPSKWENVRLGEIGDWGAGSTPLRGNSLFYDGEINWFKSGELNNGIIDYESKEKITELAIKKSSLRLNKPGDVLIAMYGATIGKTAILNIEGTTNQAVCACTPFSCISSTYLHLLLKGLKDVFINQGEGGAQPNISRVKIRNQVFGLPPLEEQREIVRVVEILFNEVEQLEQLTKERIALKEDFVMSALRQLTTENTETECNYLQNHFKSFFTEKDSIKKLREALLQLAVQGKLTVDWRKNNPDTEPATELLKRIQKEKAQLIKDKKIKDEKQISSIKDQEIPYNLPSSWIWCRMQDLCPNISSGSTPPKSFFNEEDGIPYLKVYNIRNQLIDFDYKKQFVDAKYHSTKLKRSILKPGDVIMNIVGPPLGKVAIIPTDYPEWNCNQAISFFQPLDKKLNTWIYTYLLAGTFLERIELIGTAGQDNISVTKSKTIILPLPPVEEQKAIVEKVNALMLLCDQLEQEIEESKNLNEQLMKSVLREVFN